ncbi:DUF6603 domain-containing protein [Micromonospora costi]|uniref:DUF6603 domain-containing protein n=1 Tax=Micromonospora costi TaxID=1530042 RepID=A0A3A9ZV41_9ACTN|nr:DUF6603 domain-containing protein [Micromonospora costi]RKN52093.1 hypothetical protein D7193_26380 [Micromonospora costi]
MPPDSPNPATDILSRLAAEAQNLVEPLVRGAQHEQGRRQLLLVLGWDLDQLTGYPVEEMADAAAAIGEAAAQLAEAASTPTQSLDGVLALVQDIAALVDAIRAVADLADAPGVQVPQDVEAALAAIGQSLVEFLLLEYLTNYHPTAHDVARALTLIHTSADYLADLTPPLGGADGQPVYRLPAAPPRFQLDRLADLLTDPVGTLRAAYLGPDGLSTADAARTAAGRIWRRLTPLLVALGAEVSHGADAPGAAERDPLRTLAVRFPLSAKDPDLALGALLQVLSDAEGGARLVVTPTGWAGHRFEGRSWAVEFTLAGQAAEFAIGREGVTLPAGGGALTAGVVVERLADAGGQPTVVGAATGTRLELGGIRVTAGLDLGSDGWDATIGVRFDAGALVVGDGDGDGFLAEVLPADGVRAPFEFALTWSRSGGLTLSGAAGLALSIPVHSALGPLHVQSIDLAIGTDGTTVTALAAGTVDVRLGPLVLAVERVGVEAVLSFPPGGGNLGPAALDLRFKPPSGAGVALDAGPVTGGGYLYFDPDAEQYAGVVQLEFQTIALTAVGLLTTRMPDGSDGFSLLMIIAAEFPPINLGFGFTLNGAGGILGINRTVNVDALRAGVKSRAIDSVMFPADPVANAPQIVSNLATYFPPAPGRFVFGPMARIGWGTPTLITLDLGLVLELPAPVRLLVLGKLRMTLPDERAPVVSIRMDVLGVIDFDRGEASVDATLHDSQVAGFALTGDMAMRMRWAANPTFALAAGGFHPRFAPPPGFPHLDRLALSLATGDNPRLRLEAYLALTSNTAQVGARVELYAAALGFSISGHLAFDALFRFTPFQFVVDMSGAMALRRGRDTLMAVTVDASLSGPNRWHASGRASFKIWIFEGSVSFDVTTGDAVEAAAITPVDLGLLLDGELEDPANWAAQLPPAGESLVTLRQIEPAPHELLAHPLGGLAFRQRAVPFGVHLDKAGQAPLVNGDRFDVTGLRVGADTTVKADVLREHFAPAYFLDLTDDEKLSRPSFEEMEAGRRFADPKPALDGEADLLPAATLGYETVIVDAPDAPARPAGVRTMDGPTSGRLAHTGPAGLAATRHTGARRFHAPTLGIGVTDTRYALRPTGQTAAPAATGERTSYTEVVQLMRELADDQPRALRIVPDLTRVDA